MTRRWIANDHELAGIAAPNPQTFTAETAFGAAAAYVMANFTDVPEAAINCLRLRGTVAICDAAGDDDVTSHALGSPATIFRDVSPANMLFKRRRIHPVAEQAIVLCDGHRPSINIPLVCGTSALIIAYNERQNEFSECGILRIEAINNMHLVPLMAMPPDEKIIESLQNELQRLFITNANDPIRLFSLVRALKRL